jgi:hypothetical protein
VVDAELVDPSVGLVRRDRYWGIARPRLTAEVNNVLLNSVAVHNDAVDLLDRDLAFLEPCVDCSDVRSKRPHALDPPADRIVQLGLAGERADQRVGLTGEQTGVVGHTDAHFTPPRLL